MTFSLGNNPDAVLGGLINVRVCMLYLLGQLVSLEKNLNSLLPRNLVLDKQHSGSLVVEGGLMLT